MIYYLGLWARAYHILRRDYKKFEVDPKTQLKYHRKMVIFWMLNWVPMNLIVTVDIWAALTNRSEMAIVMSAILLAINTNYSLYANWDTETGDAHAAYASVKAEEIEQHQSNTPSSVEPMQVTSEIPAANF